MADSYKRTWASRRGERPPEQPRSYYGLPVIHAPHWKWMIVIYFFLGGISGASFVLASIAETFGGAGARRIVRAGRYLSLAALIPSPLLLIFDLGRPERFLYMLRVVKLRSPMSVGTWGLTMFGGFCGLAALVQAAQDGLLDRARPIKRLLLALPRLAINGPGSALGMFVAGYTGVLLGATAVPVWARNVLLLGPLFLSSAVSSAAAALSLVLALGRGGKRPTARLERLDMVTLSSELALVLLARSRMGLARGGRLGRALDVGVIGGGILAPLAIKVAGRASRRHGRAQTVLTAALVLVGAFLLRYVWVFAGPESARDPQATFDFARRH